MASNYNSAKFGYNSVEVEPSKSKLRNLDYQFNQFDTKAPLYLKFIQSLDKFTSKQPPGPAINL